jgi:DNA-binding SARP family transcriptional activator
MAGPGRSVAEQQRHPRTSEAPDGEPKVVRLWLLGNFKVSVGHRIIGEKQWRLKKAGSLLKLLALAPGHRLRREQAMELLWPGLDPEAAANNLHYALHVARRTLEPASPGNIASRYLTLREALLALCPDGPLWVDVEAFERAAATARRSREPAAYRAAVELYVGDLLPEDRYEPWAEERREHLRRSHLALLLERAGLHEEREEYGPAIESLRRAAAEEPTREEAHANLMRLYALTGRHQEAILQYERLRNALREQLDEEPGAEIKRLLEEIREGQVRTAPSPSVDRPSKELVGPSPNNLPASLTSFVGREKALLEVKRLLSMTRLLTLTGAGGAGKTRLAMEVARDLLGAYPEGVWLVELAPVSDPALTPQAVAAALGVREQPGRPLTDTLTDHLRAKDSLLVLDNCEHLVDAAAHLAAALLESCPKLRILATSREPLGVPGEAVWTVPPLSLPDAGRASSVEGLMASEAVQLFLDRTSSRLPGFGLGEENAGAVGRICRKLEGAARLGWALWLFWWVRGRFTEGRSWMEEALAKGSAMPATARARALFVAGMMADGQADLQSAEPLIEEGLGLFREIGGKQGISVALYILAMVAHASGDDERAKTMLREGLEPAAEVGDESNVAYCLQGLAALAASEGGVARAAPVGSNGGAFGEERSHGLRPRPRPLPLPEPGKRRPRRARRGGLAGGLGPGTGHDNRAGHRVRPLGGGASHARRRAAATGRRTGRNAHLPRARDRAPRRAGAHKP